MRSDSNCWMEVLHNDRHLDGSITSVSRSAGTIGLLHRLRLALSVSIFLSLATTRSCTIFQLTVEDDIWQSVVAHSYHVASPAKLSCNHECLDAGYVTDLEHLGVGPLVLLSNVCNPP